MDFYKLTFNGAKHMNIHIITNCSSTRLIAPVARVQDLPTGLTNAEAIDKWVDILNSHKKSTTPREQYRGQGFITLLKTLNDFKPESVQIVTGGLGLTDIDDDIVPYDFSGSPKEEHNITQKVTREPFALNVWWSMINSKRFGEANPVARYLEEVASDPEGVCLISCSKIFLKYIAQDFLSASEAAKNRTKILLTASSIGSVPMQLRPYIVSFERSAVAHIPGNRNDINHRAMWMFLDHVRAFEDFTLPSWKLSATVFGAEQIEGNGGGSIGIKIDIPATLKDRPELLKLDPESAYKTLYREVGPFGGRQNFKGNFIKAQMDAGLIKSEEISEADDDALDALGGLGLKAASPQISNNDTADGLKLMQTFVSALQKANPTAEFTPADVCSWAKVYSEKKGLTLPDVFGMPIKLAYFLKSYHEVLNLNKNDKSFSLR
jgi:hypothetical protein